MAQTQKSVEELTRKELGRCGENAGAAYLAHRGYDILARNWRCSAGEVDIVARDDDMLVFVEVKTRKGVDRGFPYEAVTPEKRDRYERIALQFLGEYETGDLQIRFDILGITIKEGAGAAIRHHMNAFGSGEVL